MRNSRCQVRLTSLESYTPECCLHSRRLKDIVFKSWLQLHSCPRTLSPTRTMTRLWSLLTWTSPPQQPSVHKRRSWCPAPARWTDETWQLSEKRQSQSLLVLIQLMSGTFYNVIKRRRKYSELKPGRTDTDAAIWLCHRTRRQSVSNIKNKDSPLEDAQPLKWH